jgi:hypothetical protein
LDVRSSRSTGTMLLATMLISACGTPAASSSLTAAAASMTVQVWRIRHQPSGFDALAYVCSLEEDFDGAPRCYGEPNPGRFGAIVNPASNPDTSLQADVVARVAHRAPDRANSRAVLDFLGNATSPHKNFGVNNEFAWVGLTSLAPSEARKIPNADPKKPPINVPSLDIRRGMGARFRKNAQGDLVTGPNGEHFFPVIQGTGAPAPGFFVSTTAVARSDPAGDRSKPFFRRQLDSLSGIQWMDVVGRQRARYQR